MLHRIPCVENVVMPPQKIFDADFTPALRCPKFPRDGKYFFERRSGNGKYPIYWPTKETVQRIEELGCHVVPKPSKKTLSSFQKEQMLESYLGTSAVLEWRYSFSQAEMVLADNIPEIARTSYLALKAVVKTHINRVFDDQGRSHKIPSYALKTILFYEVEKQKESYWTHIDQKGDTVYDQEEFFWILFDSLCASVQEKCCPHYWINTLNLFSDMKDDDFAFMKSKLEKIRKEPVKYIASEWLEWNRYMRKRCCASCVHSVESDRQVYGEDLDPVECCCCPLQITGKVETIRNGSNSEENNFEKHRKEIKYDAVAIEVY